MAFDLAAVVRAVGGQCLPQRLPERTLVDGVAEIDTFMVVGNPAYATLVTGSEQELLALLRSGGAGGSDTIDTAGSGSSGGSARGAAVAQRIEALAGAVFVGRDNAELRTELAAHGMTAILGTRLSGVELHATLSALLANSRAASDRLVTAGMNVLTQVARRGGTTAVISELAHRIDGWAVLLDTQGQLIASAGAGRLHISDAVAVALGRPVRVRHAGLQVHQVGSDKDLAGYLVVATRSTRMSHARDLAAQSAALFDLLMRTHNPSLTEHLGRSALLDTLLAGGRSAGELLRRWGVHESTLTAFELGSKTRTIDLEKLLRRWFDELGAEHVFAEAQGRVRGFVRGDLLPELAGRVESFNPVSGLRIHLGLGTPAPVESLSRSAREATQALDSALDDGGSVVSYATLPTVELMLAALSESSAAGLAGVLDPLRDSTGEHGDLTHVLRVFLSEHGAHRSSAARLGIHRQTLAARLQRIEDLTGLRMSRADDRAAAWFALRALGNDNSA